MRRGQPAASPKGATIDNPQATTEHRKPARLGPRPLPLHLGLAHLMWMSSLAALPWLSAGSQLSKPDPETGAAAPPPVAGIDALCAVARELTTHPPDAVVGTLLMEVSRRSAQYLEGIGRYHAHPYRRDLDDPPVLWREGNSRLLDYGYGDGRPILFVPSLVNRAYVLDLSHKRSLLRWLAGEGFRPLLMDWGEPGVVERQFDLSDYIAGRLCRALRAASLSVSRLSMPVVGYCMGGLLATALAQLRPLQVSGLVLMATPWDFHTQAGPGPRAMASVARLLDPWMTYWGQLPVDMLQAFFSALDPLLALPKFSSFGRLAGSNKAEDFVALEDWLNDGVPLAAPVARECLVGWYGANTPHLGSWTVAGDPVRPDRLDIPSLHLVPSRDRIVPPASALALADAMPNATVMEPPLGHIGMVVAGAAPKQLWHPLADWMRALPEAT